MMTSSSKTQTRKLMLMIINADPDADQCWCWRVHLLKESLGVYHLSEEETKKTTKCKCCLKFMQVFVMLCHSLLSNLYIFAFGVGWKFTISFLGWMAFCKSAHYSSSCSASVLKVVENNEGGGLNNGAKKIWEWKSSWWKLLVWCGSDIPGRKQCTCIYLYYTC